ncbi:MAG TPA: DUF3034 family protein [Rhizomicrobium sp.]|jgi:hypothetical protein|nr:DUF3034 family protein [Rhizomicrobium sp.]
MRLRLLLATLAVCLISAAPALADDSGSMLDKGLAMFDSGKLLATGGVSDVEGAGGGGLTTWALITGYGTRDGVGFNAHYTYVGLSDYNLQSVGVAVGIMDRVELSYAWQAFDTQKTGGALGLGNGFTFHQNVFGAKVKIFGDAVYDQDAWWPQLAAGVQYKSNDRGGVIAFVGGKSDEGVDFYLAGTKLFLAQSLLVDVTLRETKANQFGILGFGGDKSDGYSTEFEGSAAYLISRKFAIGVDYRTKPDNLSIAREDNAFDIFAAYFITKNVSVTLAYANLGNIVIHDNQQGVYLSLQGGL